MFNSSLSNCIEKSQFIFPPYLHHQPPTPLKFEPEQPVLKFFDSSEKDFQEKNLFSSKIQSVEECYKKLSNSTKWLHIKIKPSLAQQEQKVVEESWLYSPIHAIYSLIFSVIRGDSKFFIQHERDVSDADPISNLEHLFRDNNQESIEKAIEVGKTDINQRFKNGKTLLLEVIEKGDLKFAEWLLKHEADPNILFERRSIIQIISDQAHLLPFVPLLLKYGLNMDTAHQMNPYSPASICKFNLPEKICDKYFPYDAYTEEFLAQKLLAQGFKIKATSIINGIPNELGSGFSPRWADIMQQSLAAMVFDEPHSIAPEEREMLENFLIKGSYARLEASEILENISKGMPTLIHTGFSNHSVVVFFFKESKENYFLIIANKGGESRRPFEIYQIDPKLLNISKIEEIQNLRFEPVEKYLNWLNTLPNNLGAQSTAFTHALEKTYPFQPSQLVTNCSWESLETAVFAEMLLVHLKHSLGDTLNQFDSLNSEHIKKVAESIQLFLHLLNFTKFRAIETYLQKHNNKIDPAFSVNSELITAIFIELAAYKNSFTPIFQVIIPQFLMLNKYVDSIATLSFSLYVIIFTYSPELLSDFDKLEKRFIDKLEGKYKEEYKEKKDASERFRFLTNSLIKIGAIFIIPLLLTLLWAERKRRS
jgi:ankyrin repeat protein